MDNYYCCVFVKVAEELLKHKTNICGTIRANRGLPICLKSVTLKDKSMEFRRKGKILIQKWNTTKKVITMISTIHSANMVECVNKRTNKKGLKPICVRDYNKFMKGVDRADQYLSYYSILRKTKKWTKKTVLYLINCALSNAYQIYTKNSENSIRFKKFLMDLAIAWINGNEQEQESRSADECSQRSPSYFRRFIPGFCIIAKPLYDLVKKNAKFLFEEKENEAFETLKTFLANKPILSIYSPTAETELHCDASTSGFGAIVLQKQANGCRKPIAYYSQRTTPVEARYHSFELECLAVVNAIKRFRIYLSGIHFKIFTDCDSFRLTLSKQNVNPRISRWALYLQDFDYEIQHRPGKRMNHVDALSRCHSVLVVEGNTFEQTLSVCQDKDPEIRKIRDELEKTELKHFELRNGLVYRTNKKLIPKFKGPYVVKKVLGCDRYVISDIEGFQVTQMPYNGVLSPDNMKPYIAV
ncbi:Transposon Tf2-8 polyprotein [Anthophora retusa]